MKSKLLKILVTLALLAILALKADWPEMGKTLAQVSPASVGWAFLAYGVAQLLSTLRWAVLANRFGFQKTPGQYLRIYCIGMFCNLFLPTSVGGDVVRALRLGAGSGRHGAAARSVLADRLSGLAMLLILGSTAVSLSPTDIPAWVRWSIWTPTALAGVGALASQRLPAVVARLPGLRIVVDSVIVLLDRPGTFVLTTLLSLVIQALNVVLVWVMGAALGLDVPDAFYWVLVPIVSLLTLLPISFNGMGVREGATVLLLTPFGVSTSQAITLSVLWFFVMSAISLSGAGFYLVGRNPRVEDRPDAKPLGDHTYQGRVRESKAPA